MKQGYIYFPLLNTASKILMNGDLLLIITIQFETIPVGDNTNRLQEKVGNWNEIKIANGSVGWLPAESLKEI